MSNLQNKMYRGPAPTSNPRVCLMLAGTFISSKTLRNSYTAARDGRSKSPARMGAYWVHYGRAPGTLWANTQKKGERGDEEEEEDEDSGM